MKVIKYVVEIQMIYSVDSRSSIVTIAEFDNIDDALDELDKEAYMYSNAKNVAIEINKYEIDGENQKFDYLEHIIGFYGIDAARYLGLDYSKKKKYGLIIV